MKRVFFLNKKGILTGVSALLLLGAGGYGYYSLWQDLKTARENFAYEKTLYENKIGGLERDLASSTEQNALLMQGLREEKGKNDYFEFQLKSLTGTVGTLQKLTMTDPELLRKYSKIYFLNENYIPATLTDITNSEYAYQNGKTISIHTNVWLYLAKLLNDAKTNSVPIQIISGYRSFGEQSSLKAGYKVTYGSGANQFSADQGYSEHQLGTTVDFTTLALGANFGAFESASAYTWLTQNAHKYGFVLSYPKNNSYYQFEPWHWRFVGVVLATKLFNEHKYFYDLSEREIDSYLVYLFD